jgi:hypothetical protein
MLGAAALLATATTAHAADASDDVISSLAAEAGVNPVDLAGAVNTTGLDAHTYLCRVGELACPTPSDPRAYLYAMYPDVAACEDSIFTNESGWRMVSNRSGSSAFGVGQFMRTTFFGHAALMQAGGIWPFAEAPDWANPLHQVAVGAFDLRRGLRSQWTAHGCGR